MDFKNKTKEYYNVFDDKIWNKIVRFSISCGIEIEDYNN